MKWEEPDEPQQGWGKTGEDEDDNFWRMGHKEIKTCIPGP